MAGARHIAVLEHGFLRRQRSGESGEGRIPPADFEWLKSLLVERESAQDEEIAHHRLLRLCNKQHEEVLQVLNFVGVLETPSGLQIEVLPKVDLDLDASRALLVKMLRAAGQIPALPAQAAMLRPVSLPLMELFLRDFLDAVNLLLKRGIASGYVCQEGNEPFLRGRLMMSRHLRINAIRPERFYVTNDRFLPDRPENRLLRSALEVAAPVLREERNQRLGRELLFAFDDVPASRDVRFDVDRCVKDRSLAHYQTALAWARTILMRLSPLAALGGLQARSLLFPMERVFEGYVARCLRRQLRPECRLRTQVRSHHLVRHREDSYFLLRPDLVIETDGKTSCVFDAKWKLIDSSRGDKRYKYGLSQADFYQLFAYGKRYLDHDPRTVCLIFPATAAFRTPLEVFRYEQGFDLFVVPFDLHSGCLLGSLPDFGFVALGDPPLPSSGSDRGTPRA